MTYLAYLALWFTIGAGIGLLAGRLVRTGMVDQSACTQDCRQGRGCTCAGRADLIDVAELQPGESALPQER